MRIDAYNQVAQLYGIQKEFKDTEGAECSRSERSGVHFTGRT